MAGPSEMGARPFHCQPFLLLRVELATMLRNTRPEPIIASEPISGVAVMRNVPTLLTGITVPE
jgi:hypothetical protein